MHSSIFYYCHFHKVSSGSSQCELQRLHDPGNVIPFLVEPSNPSLLHCVQTGFGAHTAYSVGSTAGSFLVWGGGEIKQLRCEGDNSHPSSAEVKNE